VVPKGGSVGGLNGATDGDMIGQIVLGQIGGKSLALSQCGCIWPLTHWQVQPALAGPAQDNIMMPTAILEIAFIGEAF
jgi:hypothetical protein